MTTNSNTKTGIDTISDEYVRLYYQHQYERVSRLEDQRLAITNIVMALSTGALAFGFSDLSKVTVVNGIGLPAMIAVSNLFAIGYLLRTREFIRTHKKRARRVLEIHAPDLFELNKSLTWSEEPFYKNRTFIQVSLHILLMLTALLPLLAYLKAV
ncbi:MAG TPA: hypothetical protein VF131_16630 [Blastocatellia bacterium]|nr:hypothetical protein [Blastocatellia bacterium]